MVQSPVDREAQLVYIAKVRTLWLFKSHSFSRVPRAMTERQDEVEPRKKLGQIMSWRAVTLTGGEANAMSFTGCWLAWVAVHVLCI